MLPPVKVSHSQMVLRPTFHVPTCDVVCAYTSIIRLVLEYACPVWHPGSTKKLSKDIERVQKHCLKLLFPPLSCAESKTGLERLDNRYMI